MIATIRDTWKQVQENRQLLQTLLHALEGWHRETWFKGSINGLPCVVTIHYHHRERVGKAVLWIDGKVVTRTAFCADTLPHMVHLVAGWYGQEREKRCQRKN